MKPLIVLVEDDESVASVVKEKLESAGLSVVWKQDGLDGWAEIQAHHPALALLDADLPGLNGYDLLVRIKGDTETKGTAVVMLSAQGHEAYVGNALRSGASDYILKPFRPADVLERVQRLVTLPAD